MSIPSQYKPLTLHILVLRVIAFAIFLFASNSYAKDYHLTLREWWEHPSSANTINKTKSNLGLPLLRGQTASLPSGSLMELAGSNGEVFRLGGGTQFTLLHDRQFRLLAGACVLYNPANSGPLRILGPATEVWLIEEGTIAIQVTANRGLKIICLSHQPTVELAGHPYVLEPARVYFLPPNVPQLGRSLTIDLDLFLRTSQLIFGFAGQFPSDKTMRKTAFRQAIKIRSRSNLFIGDATSPKDFDLLVVD